MPLTVHPSEPRFLFFWNHKVASRSLIHGLQSAFPDLRTYAQPGFRPPLDDTHWPRFMVVRNPWARVASCFRNKCRDALGALARNGSLEPCQRHLLKALGAWPCRPETGARRLAGLQFDEFVELLPVVRDGNSHFRLQVDVLRHATPPNSRLSWAGRGLGTLLHLGRTHYLTPDLLKARQSEARDRIALSVVKEQRVRLIRLERIFDEWREVEEALGKEVPLPWHARSASGDDWKALYDSALQERVASLYRTDLEMFGYETDPPSSESNQKV